MAEQAPETWIGQDVTVYYGRSSNGTNLKAVGKLEEVSDRGLVIRETKQGSDQTAFYPLGSVARLVKGRVPVPKAKVLSF